MTIESQSAYFTATQQACRKARETRDRIDLLKAASLLDSPRFDTLPESAQDDLTAAYAAAMMAVTGAFS